MHPGLVYAVLLAAESGQRDGQERVARRAVVLVRPINHDWVGMQARIQKGGVQYVSGRRKMPRKPYFGKGLVFADMQFTDAAKARTILKPETAQSSIKISNRH